MVGFVEFGMRLDPKEEFKAFISPLIRTLATVLGFVNDYFSWEKEYRVFTRGQSGVSVNAVWVLMKEYTIEVTEAKLLLVKKVMETEREYWQLKAEFIASGRFISEEIQILLHGIELFVGGAFLWHSSTFCYDS